MQLALLLVLLALLVVTGCGAGGDEQEALPGDLAAKLASRSDAVAERLEGGDPCAARAEAEALQADTIAAVNGGRVPARFQEELTASVGALVASIECRPVAAPAPTRTEDEEEDGDVEDGDGDDDGDDGSDDDESDRSGPGRDQDRGQEKGQGKGQGKGQRGG